ncbi:unnamed protein product, partial [Gongylonema pulchrum]|uniref:Glyco_hydro_18 domain-containing protein n=1 Tax=Gongylonema pulchrum TaxID=637853 RepID=A0A183EQS0_9BILA
VCNLTNSPDFTYVFDRKAASAYIYGGKQWLGLEDPVTMFSKASYAKSHSLAGIMIFSLAADDYEVILM